MSTTGNAQDAAHPKRLWHYTTWRGLQGIASDRAIRATDYRFLNDRRELRVAGPATQRQFDEGHSILHQGGEMNGAQFLSVLRTHNNGGEPIKVEVPPEGPAYVTSFCTKPDLLSQWRGYGGGQGYALGFRFEDLQSVARNTSEAHLLKTHYLDPDNPPQPSSGPDEEGKTVLSVVHLAQIKHRSFKEEKEWRLFVEGSTELPREYRADGGGPTPYVQISLGTVRPEVVMIGPGGMTKKRHREAMRGFLASQEWDAVRVKVSKTPLR